MTQEEALEVKDLAKPVVEALERITERKCPECKSTKTVGYTDGSFTCRTCNGTGKVRWTWEPKVGEWCIDNKNNEMALIVFHYPKTKSNEYETVAVAFPLGTNNSIEEFANEFTPLLHWEKIEEILEGVGYWLEVEKPLDKYLVNNPMMVGCAVFQEQDADCILFKRGKSRQEAVMRSVIQLAKELK